MNGTQQVGQGGEQIKPPATPTKADHLMDRFEYLDNEVYALERLTSELLGTPEQDGPSKVRAETASLGQVVGQMPDGLHALADRIATVREMLSSGLIR